MKETKRTRSDEYLSRATDEESRELEIERERREMEERVGWVRSDGPSGGPTRPPNRVPLCSSQRPMTASGIQR